MKRLGPGISPGYLEGGPWLLLYIEKQKKIRTKRNPQLFDSLPTCCIYSATLNLSDSAASRQDQKEQTSHYSFTSQFVSLHLPPYINKSLTCSDFGIHNLMVSPETHLVKNHESQSKPLSPSSYKKKHIENAWALQTINLKTESKTLYYSILIKIVMSFYFKAQCTKRNIHHDYCHRNYANRINFYKYRC